MKIVKKFLSLVFYPFAALFSIQITDAITKQCKKYPLIVFFVGLVFTVLTVLAIYYNVY